jgi:hypothetical protein
LDEFLAHGKAIAAERQRAEAEGELPDFQPLVESWGGVTLFYRKGIKDAPAYRQNHEEISEALEEGIALAEFMSPVGANADEFGHLVSVDFQNTQTKADVKCHCVICTLPLEHLRTRFTKANILTRS